MVTCSHSSGNSLAVVTLSANSHTHIRMDTYKIDYCIPDKPKECSYMFTQAVSDEDAAYYGLDWVAIHGYKLKNVTKIKVRGR